jgi:integrase
MKSMDWSGLELDLQARLSNQTAHQTLKRIERLYFDGHLDSEEAFSRYLVSRKSELSGAALNKYIQATRHYCTFRQLNWTLPIHQREQTRDRETFSEQEIINIIKASKADFQCFYALLAFSGARPSEIRLLEARNINKSVWTVTLNGTKTGEDRTIPIHESIQKLVCLHVNTIKNGRLFDFSDTTARTELKKLCTNLDIPYRPLYSFRHSAITRWVNSDMPLFQIMALSGHRNSNTTNHYYRHNLQSMRRALERDTLGIATMSKDKKFDLLEQHMDEVVEKLKLRNDRDFDVEYSKGSGIVKLVVKKKKEPTSH